MVLLIFHHRSSSLAHLLNLVFITLSLHILSPFFCLGTTPNSNLTWHLPLLGFPIAPSPRNPTPLRFFRHPNPAVNLFGRSPSLAVVVSQNNLLAVINPKNGSIVWRLLLPRLEPIIHYLVDLDNRHLALISGQASIVVRLLDLGDGRLLWSRSLGHPSPTPADGLPGNGFDLIFTTDQNSDEPVFPDLIVSIHRSQAFRLSGNQGLIRWSWKIPDQSWNLLKLLDPGSSDHIQLLLAKLDSQDSYVTQLQYLSPTTGEVHHRLQSQQRCLKTAYPPLVITPESNSANASTNLAIICVNHEGLISSALLPHSLTDPIHLSTFSNLKEKNPVLENLGLDQQSIFIAKFSDGSAIVFWVNPDGSLRSFWNFEPTKLVTTYAGSVDRRGLPYVSRLNYVPNLGLANFEILVVASTDRAPEGMIVGSTFGYDFGENGNIVKISVEILALNNYSPLSRVLLVTELGDIQLWQGEILQWERHEDLSTSTLIALHQSRSMGGSLLRVEPRDLAGYVLQLGKVLISGFKGFATSDTARFDQPASNSYTWLVGSTTGRLFAIVRGPQNEGRIVWRRNLMSPGVVGSKDTLKWKYLTVKSPPGAQQPYILVSLKQAESETLFKVQMIDGKILDKTISTSNDPLSPSRALPGKKWLASHDQDVGGSPVRFLGDRGALFKYLNPHLAVYLNEGFGSLTIEVIDQTSGAAVWAFEFTKQVDPNSINAALTENWLVLASREKQSGSTRIHSIEWFMSSKADVRVDGSPVNITSFHRAYLTAFEIKALGFTKSRLGVTSRALLAISDMDQIVSISRRFLDVRRPYGKPTAQEMEELLMMYEPMIMTDPKTVITGDRPTKDLQHVYSFPTEFESTSALIGVGLDLFAGSVAPSRTFDMLGPDFNKAQLVLTTTGLLLSTLILKPIVKNKQLKRQWYT